GYARSVNYNPSGSLLAVGSYRAVTLWNTADSKVERTLDGHRAYVTGVAFSPDGKLLASSSEDETARLWNVAEGKEIRALGEHEYPVQAVAFSPDGALVATAAGDETRVTRPGPVTLWDAATGEKKFDLVEHEK